MQQRCSKGVGWMAAWASGLSSWASAGSSKGSCWHRARLSSKNNWMMGCWLSAVEGTGAWHVAGGSWHEGWCTVADALACPWCMGKELAAGGEDYLEVTKCGAKGLCQALHGSYGSWS